MNTIKTYAMQSSAILRLNSERNEIDVNPEYQRKGDIWSKEKRQLLIDSILNDYDLPKMYFHLLSNSRNLEGKSEYDYSIIDGRQRIETIWQFMDDELRLSDDFKYLADDKVDAKGMTYSELAKNYPKLKVRFDSFNLPIVIVDTEDLDLIEDMFYRLNEAVPLNAAEKRNALGGEMAKAIRDLAEHNFFLSKVRLSNRRFQHREVTARFLFLEDSLNRGKIVDTKKPYLDGMVKSYKDDLVAVDKLKKSVKNILDNLSLIFLDNDSLLRSQANLTIYYLVMRDAVANEESHLFKRELLIAFFEEVEKNKVVAQEDITKANFDQLEFDRMTQQGTNDANSIKERVRILSKYLNITTQSES